MFRKVPKWSFFILIIAMMSISLHHSDPVEATSHREAPFITEMPKLDGTDFYMFRSYDANGITDPRVAIIANYQPLQNPGGGPNYFFLDEDAIYEIHIDNNGDAREDLTFQFKFNNSQRRSTIATDDGGRREPALLAFGGVNLEGNDGGVLNLIESYTLTLIEGDRRFGTKTALGTFFKPLDNIGGDVFAAGYANYADQHIENFTLPNGFQGKVFVGQRKDPFFINLGQVFDLVNVENAGLDTFNNVNITSFVIELPTVAYANVNAIGGWTTSSKRQARLLNPFPTVNVDSANATIEGGAFSQVSRLGNPLINELIIGFSHKDRFNASEPANDAQFLDFVLNPTFAEILQVLTGNAVNSQNRNDLVATYVTGKNGAGFNNTTGGVGEMMRLDMSVNPVLTVAAQNVLGADFGAEPSGMPNGRRPGDDSVDITLREATVNVVQTDATNRVNANFIDVFPYVQTPRAGDDPATVAE